MEAATAHAPRTRRSDGEELHLPSRVIRREAARRELPDLCDRLLPALWRTDDLADAVVADLDDDPTGAVWRSLGVAIANGVSSATPASVAALVRQAETRPSWLQPELLARGGRVLVEAGPLGGLMLGGALLFGYASPAGNKPLVLTGALHRETAKRVHATARFVEAVVRPGGMDRQRAGFAITLKVRVMHARVRQLCLESGRWDAERWGHPINQHDMVATTLLFSSAILEGLGRLGLEHSADEERAYLHLWSFVGHVMGVAPDLLPIPPTLGRRMHRLLQITQEAPDDDARRLTAAFLRAPLDEARTDVERRRARRVIPLNAGILRGVIGPELSDQLGIERNAFRHTVPVLRSTLRRGRRLRKLPGVDRAVGMWGAHYWDELLRFATREGLPSFAPPPRLG